MSDFSWAKSKQLSPLQILLATFIPSAVAFIGFHTLLPQLVDKGIPVLWAWPLVASTMLLFFVIVALVLLKKESTELAISLKERFCWKGISKKDWGITILMVLLIIVTAGLGNKISALAMQSVGFTVPDYMPFFLNPAVNPMTIDMAVLSPGLKLSGNYLLLLPMMITIILNVLTEDLYFRAWMQPKLAKYGKHAWLLSGLLFALYHTFQIWLFPTILIASCAMAYVTHRSRSVIPALTVHFVINVLVGAGGIIALIRR